MEKDFDFENELGFDPKAFLDGDEFDADIDLSQFTDEELGLTPPEQSRDSEADLELDDLLEEDESLVTEDHTQELELDTDPFDPDAFEKEFPTNTEDFGDEPDFPDGIFGQRASTYRNAPQEEASQEDLFQDEDLEQETPDETEADSEETDVEERQPRKRRERHPRPPKEPKVHKPNVFTKLFDLYFGPLLNKEQFQELTADPNKSRRRKKSKEQIFKEVYLPPIIACVALILMMAFVIGSISNAIDQKRINEDVKESQLQASIAQAEAAEAEYNRVVAQAEELAASYDFDGAAQTLENFSGYADYPELAKKRADYITQRDNMVEYKDASTLPNLSFHPLIVDTVRAFNDEQYGGKYNQNFVTVDEFRKILQSLYDNDYVLVDFDSFVAVSKTVSGEDQFLSQSIKLPSGKKPFMLTETMVNYYQYMVDPDKDCVPDAKGAGFANKLVLDESGNIKAAYVDADGNNLVGDYDLVPILESFIAEHPDFSYQGARAILATTGDEGIFGYRCNTSYASKKGNDWYEQEKAGAIAIVSALREKGYTLASYTYANDNYRELNANQINANLQSWTSFVTPVIGDIDVFVFAQGTDMSDYSGTAFKSMYTTGFRYFIASGKTPSTTINNTYVHQNRLMVTGETMHWYADRFTGMFDCNLVLDLAARGGDVPKS